MKFISSSVHKYIFVNVCKFELDTADKSFCMFYEEVDLGTCISLLSFETTANN